MMKGFAFDRCHALPNMPTKFERGYHRSDRRLIPILQET